MVFSQGGFLEKVSLCAFFLNAAVYELIGNQDLPNKAEYSLCEKKNNPVKVLSSLPADR